MNDQPRREFCAHAWVSILLRLAIASLFFSAALGKWMRGGMHAPAQTAAYFQTTFKETWLPAPLVTAHAYATPFIESFICLWLLSGFRLRWAWIFTTLFMISLAFGMSVAQKHDVAGQNYMYVFICCIALFFSPHDPLTPDRRERH
jgi:uncharacterized membrane protein YphA (DoxX/SURF4 family)